MLREQEARAKTTERRFVIESCLAVACAVALTASLVEWQALDHGQWVIWSAASVVTGEAGTEHLKLRDRAIGALVGVPGSIVLGWRLPHTAFVYGMNVIAGVLNRNRSPQLGGRRCGSGSQHQ